MKTPFPKDIIKSRADMEIGIKAGYKRYADNPGAPIHVSNSKQSGKIAGISSINTNPALNSFCECMSKQDTICRDCYALRALYTYRKNAVECYTLNTLLLCDNLDDRQLPGITTIYCRFNAFGELMNKTQLDNMIRIVIKNPGVVFSLFTKRIDLVKQITDKPDNLVIVYSNPKIDKPIKTRPKNVDHIFNVLSKDDLRVNCSGKCIECKICYQNKLKSIRYEVLK